MYICVPVCLVSSTYGTYITISVSSQMGLGNGTCPKNYWRERGRCICRPQKPQISVRFVPGTITGRSVECDKGSTNGGLSFRDRANQKRGGFQITNFDF